MIIDIMTIPVVQFSKEGYKTKGFWLKINCSQMKSLNFANWCSGEVSKSAKNLTLRIRILLFFIADGVRSCVY